MSMSGCATRIMKTTWRTASATSSSAMTGLGMRRNGELVHHALDVVDLAHDRVGAFAEIRGLPMTLPYCA